jgi:hypothetical protein
MKFSHLLKKTLLASSMALLISGCAGTAEESAPEETPLSTQEHELLAACDPVELEEVVEHSCVHAQFGPFEAVTAAALGAPVFADVSIPHTAYNVTLPASGTWGWAGRLSYIPEETGEIAFLLSRLRGLRIFEAATGVEVPIECRYRVPTDVCSQLKTAYVADLVAGTEYYLEFRALLAQNASFMLVVEEAAHHEEEAP